MTTALATEHCPHCRAVVGPYDKTCGACHKGLGGAALLATHSTSPNSAQARSTSPTFLLVLAVLGGLAGLLLASQATMGVAVLAFACLLAIFGRIIQAEAQHKALIERLR